MQATAALLDLQGVARAHEIVRARSNRRPASIRRRLNRLVLLSVGLALLAAGLLNTWREADRYLAAKRETLLATAHVFGAAASKAVAAGDAASVRESMRAVARIPGLIHVGVEDRAGIPLADLGSAVRLGGDGDIDEERQSSLLRLLTSRTVGVSVPVIESGETVGRLSITSDTSDLAAGFRSALLTALAGSAIALVFGLALARRLQGAITHPLTRLADAMRAVERTGRYVALPEVRSDDEIGLLTGRYNAMIAEIGRATDEILAREDEIIARLSRAGEQRDDQTGQHVVRVAKISRIVATELGAEPKWVDDLCRASPMHDVGKISIPDAILHKPGRLDPAERALMEKHAEAGHRVLAGSQSKLVQLAAEIAISHHERWDGQGYPYKVAGERIPLSGRITAVADVCDALLSERPYKQPWALPDVRQHLLDNAGTHFDPACVRAIVARWDDLTAIYAPAAEARRVPASAFA